MDESARQAAQMAIRVLRGERPADIPLKQVQSFALHVSRRSANAFGITLPEEVVASATRVIE
jgi:putative ABC transport system substrate-binding protein